MKKTLLASAILLSTANMAHAGFLDFLFGNKEEAAPAAEAPAKQAQTAGTAAAPAEASNMETVKVMAMGLLPTLITQLGVTETQAQGGMGSILQVAQGALSSDQFGQLSQGIPGMKSILSAAPMLGSGGDALNGVLANAGGMAAGLGVMGKLTEQFEALGLSPDMIMQFVNLALSYFSNSEATGASTTGDLLQTGLSAILGQK